ncbi:mitochondrial 28S ribosomal protein s31 domain-containing protein [Ditylenchus destructor]|uniref:Small ribosomal subunit protein mS31 n=1 Tax=Ditylenchus destructor TaxID=166010 RepID=A0AAD4NJS1_9BILA|nr:mitochondrial 28S ribosomal protein s31 domain-containing protein [Ditylenchus destructor]
MKGAIQQNFIRAAIKAGQSIANGSQQKGKRISSSLLQRLESLKTKPQPVLKQVLEEFLPRPKDSPRSVRYERDVIPNNECQELDPLPGGITNVITRSTFRTQTFASRSVSSHVRRVINYKGQITHIRSGYEVEPNYDTFPPFFESAEKYLEEAKANGTLIFGDQSKLREHNLPIWRELDGEVHEQAKLGLGPRNGFEEQIRWTKEGKTWQYPITNEGVHMPSEERVGFVDHVLLDRYWAEHRVPKNTAVEQFMELVLVGLSKNPHMTIQKKQRHINWFANFFKTEMQGRYRDVLSAQKNRKSIASS